MTIPTPDPDHDMRFREHFRLTLQLMIEEFLGQRLRLLFYVIGVADA